MTWQEELLAKQKIRIDEWEEDLAQLRLRVEKMAAERKAGMEGHLDLLQRKVEEARRRFASLEQDQEKSRDEIMKQILDVWGELKEILDEMNARLE